MLRSSRFMLAGAACIALIAGATVFPATAQNGTSAIPNFGPDSVTAWTTSRPTMDDFLPPESGPGPVMSDPKHPYTPNGSGQPTYRVADLTNPILKPSTIQKMKKANDDVLSGKVPYIARERCWPAGVPGLNVYTRGQPIYFIQTPKEVLMVNELSTQIRHIYMNVPHTAHPTPSWYGESVGRYEGGELVIDTIGLNDRTFVDNYHTPHTDQLHVIERFKLLEGGKILQAHVTVDDPGTFNMPWSAIQRWRSVDRPLTELMCAENNRDF